MIASTVRRSPPGPPPPPASSAPVALIAARLQARAEKNWAESDRIRDQLTAMGVVLEDGKGGTTWRLAE